MLIPRFHVIIPIATPLQLVTALADAGVDAFQVRDKQASTQELVNYTRQVVITAHQAGAVVVVNDRVDVALAAAADGVHLGAQDLAVADARGLAPHLMIGATCRNPDQVAQAARDGASYAGFGPLYPSSSKPDLPEPLGTAALGAACGGLPLIGIGGLDASRSAEAMHAGAHGVALISSVMSAPDPPQAAREVATALKLR